MNLLFTTSAAPLKNPFSTKEKRPPLGLGSLMAVARKEGHPVFFVDNYLKPSGFPSIDDLVKNQIDVVGIYSNTICFRDSLRMFEALESFRRRKQWNGKIMVGGPHASVAPETIPEYVDYVVQGEGELALMDILDGRAKSRILRGQRVSDLDVLPFQPWDIFNPLPYDRHCPWMDIESVFTLNTSRGCPFDCAFCSVGSVWGKRYAYQSAERIVEEMKYLIRDYGAQGFYFREDHFTLNLKRTQEFCSLILKENLRVPWACETRVDRMNEDLVALMAAAGCVAVYLGVESGSQRVLNLLNKNITVRQIEESIDLCKKKGINTYCSLIVGVPGETYEDYRMTRSLMERVKPYSYTFNVFVGIPTSSLYRQLIQEDSYEYRDDLGLLYLPGYHIKTKAFYGTDSHRYVDYDFQRITPFDEKLLEEIHRNRWKRRYRKCVSIVPKPIVKILSPLKKRLLDQ